MEDNVIQFPAVGTWRYNSQRLHRYADSLYKAFRFQEFEICMAAQELYDHVLIDLDWDPQTGEPVFKAKSGGRVVIGEDKELKIDD